MTRTARTAGALAGTLVAALLSVAPAAAAPTAQPAGPAAISTPGVMAAKKKPSRGVLRVKVTGTGTFTVRAKGFRKTGTATKTLRVKPGRYTVKAPGASVKPKKTVRVRKGKTTTVRVRFPSRTPEPGPTPTPTSTPSPTPSESPTQPGNEQTVVSDGGAISVSLAGVTVEAPAGAISAGQTLTVRKEPDMVLPRGGVGGSGLTLTTSQGQPAKPVTVTLSYTPGAVERPLIVHRGQDSEVWVPEVTTEVAPGKAQSVWDSFSSGGLVDYFVYAVGSLTGNRASLPDPCRQPPSFVVNHNFSSQSTNVNDSLFSCHTTATSEDWVGVEFTNNRGYPLMMRITGGQFELAGASMPTSTVSALNQAISRVANLGSGKTDVLVLAPGSTTSVRIPRRDPRTTVTIQAQGVVFSSVAGAGLSLLGQDKRLETSVKLMDCIAAAMHSLNAGSTVDEGLSAVRTCADAALAAGENSFVYFPDLSPAEFKKLASGLGKLAKAILVVDVGQRIADAWVDGLFPPRLEYTTEQRIRPIDPPAHPKTVNTYIARDPDTGRSVLVDRGRVTVIGTGSLFNCLARTRAVWDIPDLKALNQPPDGTQISCYDEGPEWTYTPTAEGGNTGTNIILRDTSTTPHSNYLINSAGEIQTIEDGGTYLCLAAANPVIWNVPNERITQWRPANTTPASCGNPAPTIRARSLAVGGTHVCGLDTANQAWCWGSDWRGQLGTGIRHIYEFGPGVNFLEPTRVVDWHSFQTISTGEKHTCAIDMAGQAWCWGSTLSGQVGDGSDWDFFIRPVRVVGNHTFSAISAGSNHTCALDVEGRAWCWGDDRNGQLGDGYADQHGWGADEPVPVQGDHRFDVISAGDRRTCAIDDRGAAWCWGADDPRSSPTGYTYEPTAVGGHHNFTTIAVEEHTCALDDNAQAWCWGGNDFGQAGNGSPTTDRLELPVPVGGGHDFVSITTGYLHTCALDTDAQAWCWGSDGVGQVGDGGAADSSQPWPVAVAGDHAMMVLSAGWSTTCAIDVGHQAWCWGSDSYGKLGDGTAWSDVTPAPIRVIGGLSFRAS